MKLTPNSQSISSLTPELGPPGFGGYPTGVVREIIDGKVTTLTGSGERIPKPVENKAKNKRLKRTSLPTRLPT